MKNDPFLKNMWSAELVLETYGEGVRVYPDDNIRRAFDVSESIETIVLLRKHENEISGASDRIQLLTRKLEEDIIRVQREHNYQFKDEDFDVVDFLTETSLDINEFKGQFDSYLCWPASDLEGLKPCFKHYHIYKFYEEYMGQIPHGVELFLKLLPDLHGPIDSAMISDKFYWDQRSIDFLYDYEAAIDELKYKHSEKIEVMESKNLENPKVNQ